MIPSVFFLIDLETTQLKTSKNTKTKKIHGISVFLLQLVSFPRPSPKLAKLNVADPVWFGSNFKCQPRTAHQSFQSAAFLKFTSINAGCSHPFVLSDAFCFFVLIFLTLL